MAAAILCAGPALAGPIGITPTQLDLSPQQRSDLIAITNESDDEIRLQIDVFAWDQHADGGTALTATQDIVAFPPLLVVGAHETKRIRVGAAAPPGEAEKGYRLTIQELPPPPREGVTGVQILTNISLPVFLLAGPVRPNAKVEAQPVSGGSLSFAVRDDGTQHILLRGVSVTGTDARGAKTFEAHASGWYVLAHGTREYQLTLSGADCRATHELLVKAQLQDSEIETRLPVAAGGCGSGAKTEFIIANDAVR